MHFFNIIFEMTNIRRSENQTLYFADWTKFMTDCKYRKFKTVNFFNIILYFINPAQRFNSFLIKFKHVTNIKKILNRFMFFGKRFFYFYFWRFWHIILFRRRCKLASARIFLSIRESELEINIDHLSNILFENN
jgi:hypothetical protein